MYYMDSVKKTMAQTITLRIWNEQEGKVTKNVEIDNVLSVEFCSKYSRDIDFFRDSTEIFIDPELSEIEFSFLGNCVFITIKDCEAQ